MNEEASMDQLFLEKVHEAIENNLANENFGVDELAHEIGISRSQLHRRLNILTEKSAKQMIKEFRLEKALEMKLSALGPMTTHPRSTVNPTSGYSIIKILVFQKSDN